MASIIDNRSTGSSVGITTTEAEYNTRAQTKPSAPYLLYRRTNLH